jgi:hypothetical protein
VSVLLTLVLFVCTGNGGLVSFVDSALANIGESRFLSLPSEELNIVLAWEASWSQSLVGWLARRVVSGAVPRGY